VSLTNPRDALHHSECAANKSGGRSIWPNYVDNASRRKSPICGNRTCI